MPVVFILFKWFSFFLLTGVQSHSPATERHPFYISVTEVAHNAKEKSLEVSCKIFADDMEAALSQQYKMQVDLASEKQALNDFGF